MRSRLDGADAIAARTQRAPALRLVYGLCASCFMRVVGPALLGAESSPWLLALGDVLFVTLGFFVWVMVLAEDRPISDFGFRSVRWAPFLLTSLMGLGAAAVYALGPYRALLSGNVTVTADSLVFSLLYASVGSAIPDEMLFRGYLMGSLDGRTKRWARVALPAVGFTLVRSFRYAPWTGLSTADWLIYVFGAALPLGLWWGLMCELAGGSIWPALMSHFAVEFGTALTSTAPQDS